MIEPNSAADLRGAVDLTSLVRRANAPASDAPQPGARVFPADDLSFGSAMELSQTVPVLVEFIDDRSADTGLAAVVESYAGRVALARVDALANPQLVQAFQVQQVPFTAAVIGGRPVPLFVGAMPEAEVKGVIDQVLELAAQQGVAGTLGEPGEAVDTADSAPLPPLHQAAYDAIAAGDYPAAVSAYEQALRENPRDAQASAGLAQVRLLERLAGEPDEADRRFAAGDADGAFDVLFAAFASGEDREATKVRLLEYFEILGEDPRVGPARRRLTSLLY